MRRRTYNSERDSTSVRCRWVMFELRALFRAPRHRCLSRPILECHTPRPQFHDGKQSSTSNKLGLATYEVRYSGWGKWVQHLQQ